MNPKDIHPGRDYLVRVPTPMPGQPRAHATRRVSVTAVTGRTVTVQTHELVCTNLTDYDRPDDQTSGVDDVADDADPGNRGQSGPGLVLAAALVAAVARAGCSVAWAMANGRLRYKQRPVRREVRAADIIAAAPVDVAEAAVA